MRSINYLLGTLLLGHRLKKSAGTTAPSDPASTLSNPIFFGSAPNPHEASDDCNLWALRTEMI